MYAQLLETTKQCFIISPATCFSAFMQSYLSTGTHFISKPLKQNKQVHKELWM